MLHREWNSLTKDEKRTAINHFGHKPIFPNDLDRAAESNLRFASAALIRMMLATMSPSGSAAADQRIQQATDGFGNSWNENHPSNTLKKFEAIQNEFAAEEAVGYFIYNVIGRVADKGAKNQPHPLRNRAGWTYLYIALCPHATPNQIQIFIVRFYNAYIGSLEIMSLGDRVNDGHNNLLSQYIETVFALGVPILAEELNARRLPAGTPGSGGISGGSSSLPQPNLDVSTMYD